MKHRRALASLRNDTLSINTELGRHQRPIVPLHERLCTLCQAKVVEDGPHVLLECQLYDDLRMNMNTILAEEALLMAPTMEQFNFLMSDSVSKTQQVLSKTIYNIMERRKSFSVI